MSNLGALSVPADTADIPQDVCTILHTLYNPDTAPLVCISATGSGGQAFAWLLGVAGASSCLLEATVPYCTTSGREWMGSGRKPASWCSEEAARLLAKRAYYRAAELATRDHPEGMAVLAKRSIIGVGCTAAVASSRPIRGEHRCFVSTHTHGESSSYELTMSKGSRDRVGEDTIVSRLVVRALAEAAGVSLPPGFKTAGLILMGETAEVMPVARTLAHPDPLEALASGSIGKVFLVPHPQGAPERPTSSDASDAGGLGDGCVVVGDGMVPPPAVILPGSFNPVHEGHIKLALAARRLYAREVLGEGLGGPVTAQEETVAVVFEVSVTNADKGTLPLDVIRSRAEQFTKPGGQGHPYPLALTRVPLFVEKARLFPGCAFVVGADTIDRIIDPKYYANSAEEMAVALAEIKFYGCRFIVGGRSVGGAFLTLGAVLARRPVPASLRALFLELLETDFRLDLSSTELREKARNSTLLTRAA